MTFLESRKKRRNGIVVKIPHTRKHNDVGDFLTIISIFLFFFFLIWFSSGWWCVLHINQVETRAKLWVPSNNWINIYAVIHSGSQNWRTAKKSREKSWKWMKVEHTQRARQTVSFDSRWQQLKRENAKRIIFAIGIVDVDAKTITSIWCDCVRVMRNVIEKYRVFPFGFSICFICIFFRRLWFGVSQPWQRFDSIRSQFVSLSQRTQYD